MYCSLLLWGYTNLFCQGKEASMGLASGNAPLPYGHSADAAVDIEGLSVCVAQRK